MHARKSSCLIVLTSHSLSIGRSFFVLLLVFWAGVLLMRRFPVSATCVFLSSASILENQRSLST